MAINTKLAAETPACYDLCQVNSEKKLLSKQAGCTCCSIYY